MLENAPKQEIFLHFVKNNHKNTGQMIVVVKEFQQNCSNM